MPKTQAIKRDMLKQAGIDSTPPAKERIAEFLWSCGLTLGEQRTLGQETEGRRAWGGFADDSSDPSP